MSKYVKVDWPESQKWEDVEGTIVAWDEDNTFVFVPEESAVEGMHDIDVHVYENREDALERWKFVVGLWKDDKRCMDEWEEIKKTNKIEWI